MSHPALIVSLQHVAWIAELCSLNGCSAPLLGDSIARGIMISWRCTVRCGPPQFAPLLQQNAPAHVSYALLSIPAAAASHVCPQLDTL